MKVTSKTIGMSLGILIALIVAFFLGSSLQTAGPQSGTEIVQQDDQLWTCSMHPQIVLPQPGSCPICGMDLIPQSNSDAGGGEGPRSLSMSETARTIAEIRTAPVERREVTTNLRLFGRLEADETRKREITARVGGRIDRLYIDYTGVPVRRGQKLFELYSPELYSAQEELLQAIKSADELGRSNLQSTRLSAQRTVKAARERLRLLGLTEAQIQEIADRREPQDHITILAPMSGVVLHKSALEGTYVQTGTHVYEIVDLSVLWLKLDVYESDIAWVKIDQVVQFETDAYPGERFESHVAFIDPVLNEKTRSIKVRVNVKNPEGRLKPGMFARATLRAKVTTPDGGLPLVVPSTAPLLTGERAVVYVANPNETGNFSGREVVLGRRTDGFFVVREGLQEGERVVSNGSFKIDSALQILAKNSMMNPEGGGTVHGHEHGAMAAQAVEPRKFAEIPKQVQLQFDNIYARYFEVSKALSRDDLATAQGAARSLAATIHDLQGNELPAAAQPDWDSLRTSLLSSTHALAEAANIDRSRQHFEALSNQLITTAKSFGATGTTPIHVFHCPMAMEGAGADWLQSTPDTENPYYGSQMFRCGSKTETLVAPASTGEAP